MLISLVDYMYMAGYVRFPFGGLWNEVFLCRALGVHRHFKLNDDGAGAKC